MLNTFIIVYSSLVLLMCLVWLFYRLTKNPSVVDVSWSIGLMLAGLIFLNSNGFIWRHLVISFLLVIWSMRLAGYLWLSRVRQGHIDKRYLELSENWKINRHLGFFLNFQFQALLILIIASPFALIGDSAANQFSKLDIFPCLLVVIGVCGETLADFQLQRFKSTHQKQVCNVGLWYYSRHPNYFFDWLTWCGFSMFAYSHPLGCLSLISPLLLYIIFTRITGPMTELSSIKSRGQSFIDYQKTTSMFFPWFKRQNAVE